MKQLLNKHRIIFIVAIAFLVTAFLYLIVTPSVYLSTSRVAIFRIKVESPDRGGEDSRNRWIWIRDGLNMNSALVSDSQVAKFTEINAHAKVLTQKFPTQLSKINYLKSLINVKYTGADENNYIIEVRAPDAILAHDLNQHIFDQLKFLAIQKDQEDFDLLVERLRKQSSSEGKNSERDYFQEKIVKMKFEHAIVQAQKEQAYQVISEPTLDENKIWPKSLPVLLAALLVGLVIGFAVEYATEVLKSVK